MASFDETVYIYGLIKCVIILSLTIAHHFQNFMLTKKEKNHFIIGSSSLVYSGWYPEAGGIFVAIYYKNRIK